MKKRILSLILCLAMVLMLLPAAVFAADNKITIVTVNVPYSLADGEEMFFDNSLITVGDPALYRAYLWGNSWTGPEGMYMPDEYNMPHFKGGERYTLMVLIVPEDGATGLDSSTAPFLPVYINGMRARFNPACSPWIEEAPDKTIYAYEIDLQCPYANVIDIVEIFGFVPPTPGAVPCDINDLSVPENAPYYIRSVIWERYNGDPATSSVTEMAAGETFAEGVYYYLNLTLCPYDGYTFSAGDVTWRINGTPYNGYADEVYSYISSPTVAKLYSADLKAESRHIDYIDIEGLGGFYQGTTVYNAIKTVTAPNAEGYRLVIEPDVCVTRYSDNTYIDRNTLFLPDESYRATFEAYPEPGWTIDNDTVWTINGSAANVSYAAAGKDYWYVKTNAFPSIERMEIDRIDVYGCVYPEVGKTAGDLLTMYVVGGLYELVDCYWFCDTDSIHMAETDTFEEGKLYSACVVVKPIDPAFVFSNSVGFNLNGGYFPSSLAGLKPDGSFYIWTQQMEAGASVGTHTVSWYLDPADEYPVAGAEVNDGEVFGLPAEPSKEGYTFGGWYTDRYCVAPYDPTAPIYADIDLFPLWIPAVDPDKIAITAVDAQIPVPVVGQEPAGTASVTLTSTPNGAPLYISGINWFYWDEDISDDNKWEKISDPDYVFVADMQYAVDIFVRTEEGGDYVIDPAVVGTVNGQPSDDSYDDIYQDANTVYLSYVWTAQTEITITAVDAQIPVPVAGQQPAGTASVKLTSTPEGAPLSVSALTWFYWDDSLPAENKWMYVPGSDYVFEAGETYAVDIFVQTEAGCDYIFDPALIGTVNGQPSDDSYDDTYQDAETAYLSFVWTVPEEPVDPCEGYTDIDRSMWYHNAADYVIEKGYMGSTNTDTLVFEPMTKVSRCMVASILYRIAGDGEVLEYQGTFKDVEKGKWYTTAIEWCAKNGLASGKGGGIFDPMGDVTRQELAVFMYKLAEFRGGDVSGKADLSSFADAASVLAWSKDYLAWAVDAGIISGQAKDGKTFLNPTAGAMRCELASILMRFFAK